MNQQVMRKALEHLDKKLKTPVEILIGGGAAMLLAHGFPLATLDIDGLVLRGRLTDAELDPLVKAVAKELSIPADWLNSYFNTFLYTLPADYQDRLQTIYTGKHLTVLALGVEDLLILKCFAGRPKDRPHARALYKKSRHPEIVDGHLQKLLEQNVPGSREAADFFDELAGNNA